MVTSLEDLPIDGFDIYWNGSPTLTYSIYLNHLYALALYVNVPVL